MKPGKRMKKRRIVLYQNIHDEKNSLIGFECRHIKPLHKILQELQKKEGRSEKVSQLFRIVQADRLD